MRTLLAAAAGLFAAVAVAHEGHAPLPSKGVEVDADKGLITLSPQAHQALGVQTATAEERVLESTALAYATTVIPWQQRYFVSSQVPGKIARLHVSTGQAVTKGQVLAEIASAELETLRLELANAHSAAQLSAKQLVRAESLSREQVISGRDLLEAQTKDQENKNAIEVATAKLKILDLDDEAIAKFESGDQKSVATIKILSPIAGVVSHTDLALGKVVGANEHLFEVNNLAKLWVRVGVLERDLSKTAIGQSVAMTFSALPRKTFSAQLSAFSYDLDPKTRLANYWADVENVSNQEPELLPGMYGVAKIVTSKPDKLLTIPAAALLGIGAEKYVLVEVASTSKGYEYRRQSVSVVQRTASLVQVRGGGVYPGDQVVTVGGHVLSSFFVLGVLRLSPDGIRNIGLKVEPVKPHVVEEIVNFDGQVDLPPGRRATVSSQVSGVLHRVLVDRGQAVEAGQAIAEVTGLVLQETQLDLIQADLELRLLTKTLERLRTVAADRVVAAKQLWDVEARHKMAESRQESARRKLLTFGLAVDQVDGILATRELVPALPVRSPIAGRVVGLLKTLGEAVQADESLLEVHDLSHPWVRGFLSEREATLVRPGTPVRIRLPGNETVLATGHVARSARVVEDQNRALSVWIESDSPPEQLLPQNLLVRLSAITRQPPPTLAVPKSAIVREGTRAYVFIQKPKGILERQHVELGRSDDRFQEVLSGIKEGDKIAVQGVAELQTTFASVR